MIQAEVHTEQEEHPWGNAIRMFLVDRETGRELTDEEVERAFAEGKIVGVFVRPRDGHGPGGCVVEYTETGVVIDGFAGSFEFLRAEFHERYRLD